MFSECQPATEYWQKAISLIARLIEIPLKADFYCTIEISGFIRKIQLALEKVAS